jgi:hypothetical protein
MMRSPFTALALRSIAIAIALTALLDPAITSNRTTKPVVSVVASSPSDAPLSDRVERALSKTFTVVRAPAPNADATVLIGDSPPPLDETALPAFAVFADRSGPTLALAAVRAPSWTPADARAPITIVAHVAGARGRTLDVTLENGSLVVDRVTRTITSDDERSSLTLGFLPTTVGAVPLRVSAHVDGAATASANVVIDARDKRWAVLFFDPRPSWMSTFARRALEQDSRFVVSSRVVTSRNVSTDAGNPPGRLDDLAALQLFDAVVVGAPEALTANDVAGLDAFLRRRGGSVVLLFDRRAAGGYERLTQVANWSADSGKAATIAPINGDSGDSGAIRASEITWPARLPDGADVVARAALGRPVVWRSAVGAGQLIVSGALDAWRFRDRSISAFDRFWQAVIADAATNASPTIELAMDNSAIAPGAKANVAVTIRDAALSTVHPAGTSVSATLEPTQTGQPATNVRLWPDANAGQFVGAVRGASPGMYRLVVASGGSRAALPIVVASDALHPTVEARDLVTAFANAHGGRAFPATQIKELPSALRAAIRATPRLETWHPMRSAWWIVPFALALSGEWWLRRRRGLV